MSSIPLCTSLHLHAVEDGTEVRSKPDSPLSKQKRKKEEKKKRKENRNEKKTERKKSPVVDLVRSNVSPTLAPKVVWVGYGYVWLYFALKPDPMNNQNNDELKKVANVTSCLV